MPTVRIPLVGSPNNRSGDASKDQRYINCFPETIKNEVTESSRIFLNKRFGTSKLNSNAIGGGGVARGFYPWSGYLISAIDNKLYFTSLSGTTTQYTTTFSTSTGYIGFCEAVDNGADVLVVSDGIGLWKLPYGTQAAGGLTACSAGYPTPHHPFPVFMDGYLFLQKVSTGGIYNSAIHDVDSWSSANYITPETYQDPSLGLARQNNLIVAFGEYSIEFFYDAAQTTSPLLPNQQATIQFGCASMGSVTQNEGLVLFVAQSQTGGKFVVAVDGTEPHNISNAAIEKILEAEGSDITDCWSYMIRTQGHFFYVLNLDYSKRTLVYDLETKMWHEWNWYQTDTGTAQTGSTTNTIKLATTASAVNDAYVGYTVSITSGTGSGQSAVVTDYDGTTKVATIQGTWTITPDNTSVYSIPYYTLFPMIMQAEIGNTSYLLHDSNGFIYTVDPDLYQDAGNPIRVQIQTSKIDGDTSMLKFASRLTLLGDEQTSSAPVYVYYSDDDFQNWKPSGGRVIDMINRGYIYRLGSFRRRAFLFINSSNTPLRLEAIELEIDKGHH